jgi:hypothetical protein
VYITYSEAGTWRGYYVRVPGTPKKLFSVRGLGEAAARRGAVRYRNTQVRLLGFKSVKALARSRAPQTSGIVGVRLERVTSHYTYKGDLYKYEAVRWVASWRAKGKRVKRYFSVLKHGYRRARALAIRARAKRA